MQSGYRIALIGILAVQLICISCGGSSNTTVMPDAEGTPRKTAITPANPGTGPLPVMKEKNCPLDRIDIEAALDSYYQTYAQWPTADGEPGDIDWRKLVPGLLKGVPYTDQKCEWRINTEPRGEICLVHDC